MFGMGITEILFVAVIAIIFLGPDHLPKAMIEIAKFIKSVKKVVTETKETIEKEVNIYDLKNEALEYKNMVENGVQEFTKIGNLDLDSDMVVKKEDFATKDTPTKSPPAKEIPKMSEE